MTIREWLIKTDRRLFTFIHAEASSPKLDWLMSALREPLIWIPLYVFMLFWIIRYKKQYAWKFILLSALTAGITDFTSASLLKPFFSRVRPCFDPELQPILRNLINCGGRFGMPSSHASNHFGLATFWFMTVSAMNGRKWHWLWVWAFLICYAQVYVGKHYPFDIVVGAALGITVGWIFAYLFKRWTRIV